LALGLAKEWAVIKATDELRRVLAFQRDFRRQGELQEALTRAKMEGRSFGEFSSACIEPL
jgi:hypothetical protein